MSASKNPSTLYKYYSNIDYAIQLINKKELYFSSPSQFNDPYDFFPSIKGINTYAELLCKIRNISSKAANKNIKNWSHTDKLKLVYSIRNDFKVCCFTEIFNSFRMWSYYANGFKGCCIGFDSLKMEESTNLGLKFKVEYKTDRPDFIDMKGKDRLHQIAILAAIKNIEYKEEEWRYIKHLDLENLDLSCPPNGIISIMPNIIKEVILGSEMPKSDIEKIKSITQAEKIKLYQVKTYSAEDKYKLVKKKV